jgi:hypothetical protein
VEWTSFPHRGADVVHFYRDPHGIETSRYGRFHRDCRKSATNKFGRWTRLGGGRPDCATIHGSKMRRGARKEMDEACRRLGLTSRPSRQNGKQDYMTRIGLSSPDQMQNNLADPWRPSVLE